MTGITLKTRKPRLLSTPAIQSSSLWGQEIINYNSFCRRECQEAVLLCKAWKMSVGWKKAARHQVLASPSPRTLLWNQLSEDDWLSCLCGDPKSLLKFIMVRYTYIYNPSASSMGFFPYCFTSWSTSFDRVLIFNVKKKKKKNCIVKYPGKLVI